MTGILVPPAWRLKLLGGTVGSRNDNIGAIFDATVDESLARRCSRSVGLQRDSFHDTSSHCGNDSSKEVLVQHREFWDIAVLRDWEKAIGKGSCRSGPASFLFQKTNVRRVLTICIGGVDAISRVPQADKYP